MFEKPSVQENAPDISSLIHCANCGSQMLREAGDYICPANRAESGLDCPTTPINAAHLLSRVMPRLMKRAMTGKTLEELVGDIGDQTRPKKELQQGRLDQTESEIEELNRLRAELLEPVEQNSKAYSAVADRVAEIDQTSTGLAYEALVARNELDALNFISQEDGIRETAQDPETYLGGANPQDMQELLELMIEDIRVSPGTALIIYSDLIPGARTDRTTLD